MMVANGNKQQWFEELVGKYRAAVSHTFALHGAVGDYVAGHRPLRHALDQILVNWDAVIRFDIANGWRISGSLEKIAEYIQEYNAARGFGPSDDENEGQGASLDEALAALGMGGESSGVPTDPDEWPKDPVAAMGIIDILLHAPEYVDEKENTDGSRPRFAVVIEHAETIFPRAEIGALRPEERKALVHLKTWAKDQAIGARWNLLILITSELHSLNDSIRDKNSGVEAIHIPLPNLEQREAFIEHCLHGQAGADRAQFLDDGMTIADLARDTAALQNVHIEDLVLRAKADGGRLTWDMVRERKAEVVSAAFGDVISIMEPRFGFDAIGGMEYLKEYFGKAICLAMRKGRLHRVPKAVLMAGPPGTGKSIMAEAIARESGMNAVALDIGRMKGKYVGESEAKTDRAFEAIEALAPVVVFLDEVDQTFRRGEGKSGDSGVSDYIFGRMLQFMSDDANRGRVVFVMATNRPDQLDAAFKRAGRCDKIVALLAPSGKDREQILRVMFDVKFQFTEDLTDQAIQDFIEATEGYTGAEIEEIARKAIELADDDDRDYVSDADLERATWAIIANTEQVEFRTNLALREINDRELLPPEHREIAADRKELRRRIEAREEEFTPRKIREM